MQTGKPIVNLGSYPLFLFTTPSDVFLWGINLGRGDECVETLLLGVLLVALLVYLKIRPVGAVEKSAERPLEPALL